MKKKHKLLVLILILLISIGMISIFSIKSYNKYMKWNQHKDYFKQDKSKQKIEDWMTLRYIGSEFDIDLKKKFNVASFSFSQKRLTLNEYCSINNLDCRIIIKDLNKEINKQTNK